MQVLSIVVITGFRLVIALCAAADRFLPDLPCFKRTQLRLVAYTRADLFLSVQTCGIGTCTPLPVMDSHGDSHRW